MEGCTPLIEKQSGGEAIRRTEWGGEDVADTEKRERDEHENVSWNESIETQEIFGDGGIPRRTDSWWSVEPDVGVRSDGIPTGLGGGRINANAKEGRFHSLLQSVWDEIGETKIQRKIGRSKRLYEKTLLRSEVYEKSICQRHAILIGFAQTSYQIPWEELRIVWGYDQHSRASHRRELAERLARKYPELVRELSRFPPPPCSACWKDGSWETGIERISKGVKNRVDRLKCLGNAVVPQVAQKIGQMILNSLKEE
jgi:site-specific DNA-cytosine methylase